MMRLAVVTSGTVTGTVEVTQDGVRIPAALLAVAGVRPGDRLTLHVDGSMLVLVPPRGRVEPGSEPEEALHVERAAGARAGRHPLIPVAGAGSL
jgi:antitoxin component of MazEF toxin-antitoxin module